MRTYDADLVNRIANAPGVPELLGAEAFDFTVAIAVSTNIFLHCRGAIAICEFSAPRVYQCHLIFSPSCRGIKALRAAAEMRDFMFANHADMLWGQPAVSNRAGRKLIRMLGFEPAGFGENPLVGPVEYLTCRQSSSPQA